MTNEEAIGVLAEQADYLYGADYPHDRQAFELAIAAIEKVDAIAKELTDLKAQWDMYGGDEGITAAFKALARDRWIPCEERLPDEKRAVLVWQPQYLNSYVVFLSDGEWYVFGGYGTKVFDVTHWRPLPEPPKEEK